MISTPILAAMVLSQVAGPAGVKTEIPTWDSAKTDVDLHSWSDETFKVPQYWHRIVFVTYRGEGSVNAARLETARGPERILFKMRDLENASFEFGGTADEIWALDNTNRVSHRYPLTDQVTQGLLEEITFQELNKPFTQSLGEAPEHNPTGMVMKHGPGGMPQLYFAKPLEIKSKSVDKDEYVAKIAGDFGELSLSGELRFRKNGRMNSATYDVVSEAGVFTIQVAEVLGTEDPLDRKAFDFPEERAKGYTKAAGG